MQILSELCFWGYNCHHQRGQLIVVIYNKEILFYTGFQTYALLDFFSDALSRLHQTCQACIMKASKQLAWQVFLFLCRRVGLFEQDLANRFKCLVAIVSRKIVT